MYSSFDTIDSPQKANGIWKNPVLWFALICIWTRLATIYMHAPSFGFDANFPYYLLSFRIYFTPRAVIGTIYDFLHNGLGLGWKAFCIIRVCFCFFVYSAAGIALFSILAKIKDTKFAALFGMFIFALPSTFHPFSVISVFDVYIVSFMIALTFITLRCDKLYYALVPPLCVLAVLTHENFIFMYFPFLLGLLAWRGEMQSWKGWVKGILASVSTLGAFTVMACFRAHLHNHPALLAKLNSTLSARAAEHGVETSDCLNTLGLTYIEHIKSVWSHFFLEQYGPYQIAINVISVLLLLPAGVVIARLWLYAWRHIEQERRKPMAFLIVSCFGACLLFGVAHDYIRWITAIFMCNTVALVIVYSQEEFVLDMKMPLSKMLKWFSVCLFYLCMDPPTGICFKIAEFLAYPIYKLCQNL